MAKTGDVYTELGLGGQTLEQWQDLHDFLISHNGLPAEVEDISAVFTNDFEAYEGD
jgi:hypothetical protein